MVVVDGVFWSLNFYSSKSPRVFFTEKAHYLFHYFWYILCTFVDFCRILLACCKIVLEYFCLYLCRGAHWWFAASVTVLSARCSWCGREVVRTVVLTGQRPRGQLTLVEQVSQSNCWHNSGRDLVPRTEEKLIKNLKWILYIKIKFAESLFLIFRIHTTSSQLNWQKIWFWTKSELTLCE